jgi:multimeric flavodoxin WrbA
MSEETAAIAGGVLALQGSPRRGGNTDRLLDEVLNTAAEKGVRADRVNIRDLKIAPCLEINACLKTGVCPIKDDMAALYPKLASARVLIMATPIFFYGPSAQLKMVIDRCQALWARKYMLKQPPPAIRPAGFVIAAGATKGAKLFDGLMLTLKLFFDALDMDLAGELLVRGVDAAGAVDDRPEVLAQAREMGEKIAEIIKEGERR